MINVKISSFGKYIPPLKVSNDDLVRFVDTSDEWIQNRTGIGCRHFAVNENTSDIAIKVGKEIVKNGNIDPTTIEVVIVCTMTPDYMTPSTAAIVASNIGSKNAFAFDLSAACSGFIFGLSTAQKYIASGMYKNVLLIGAEVLSKGLDFNDRSTCVLFGDGGGGIFLEKSEDEKLYLEKIHTDGNRGKSITSYSMVNNNPFSEKNHDYKFLKMEGKEVFNFVTKTVTRSISDFLVDNNIDTNTIRYFIPHQANKRLIDIMGNRLSIPKEKIFINLQKYGNTSAGSIPIGLCELIEENKINTNDKILLTGYGGGLTWGSILFSF